MFKHNYSYEVIIKLQRQIDPEIGTYKTEWWNQ